MKMDEVAKLANVSTSTVSRVLSNSSLVNEETRRRVLEVINQVNYKPHIVARQFRTQETKIILVVVPDITSPFFAKVLRGIEHVALDNGYQVILGDTENEIARESDYIDLLLRKQADGMILLTARIDRDRLAEISDRFPVVLACEYVEGLNIPTVSIDNISSARKAAEHLIQLGHTRIAHITGSMDVILSRDRLRGYQQALMSHNIKINQAYIQEADSSFESAYNQTCKLMALETPPTAIFAFNDEIAMGVLRAVKDLGIRVPDEIAVIGFDNIYMSSICSPSLTTIDQPKYEIGQKAMELLLRIIEGEKGKKQMKYVLKDQLVIRNSCGFQARTLLQT